MTKGERTMRRHFAPCLLALGVVLAEAAPHVHAGEYASFTTIDFPGATSTAALDINAAGEIVGSYIDAVGTHGYRLDNRGEFRSIDFPRAVLTRAAGINGRGDIVGTYRLPTDPTTARHGFLLSRGEFTTIDPPGAVFTNPLGMNGSGDIVGRFCVNVPCAPEGASPENVHGFLLSNGAFTIIDVPDARGTNAWKINSRGDIVGGYTGGDGNKHVFLLRLERGDLATIDIPGAGETGLDNGGINSRGDIVAVYCDAKPCRSTNRDAHGFLLSGHYLTRIDFPGASDTNAFAINARGDIVGVYDDAIGSHGFLLTRNERDEACAMWTARRMPCN